MESFWLCHRHMGLCHTYLVVFAKIENDVKSLIIFRHLQIAFQRPVVKRNREAFVLQLLLNTNI